MKPVFSPTSPYARRASWGLLLMFGYLMPASICLGEDVKPVEPAEAEEVELRSSDGLQLFLTYYPGADGKKSVPVVILHDVGESGEDYASLAIYLQKKGHAVLVPDIRGHGQSTQIASKREGGKPQTIDGKRTSSAMMKAMVRSDMGAIRSFLLRENNAGNLNIDKLCVVGTGASALVAMNFAVEDWRWEDLAFKKQGKDVKALVLISPLWSFKKLAAATFIDDPRVRGKLSILLMVGQDKKKSFKQAKNIHTRLSNFYPEPKGREAAKNKALFFMKPDTVLQGEKLINTSEFRTKKAIAVFINARLASKKVKWQDRTSP